MRSEFIRREWEEALEKHPALVVKDNIEEWRNTLNQVISFLEEQGEPKEDQKPPSKISKDPKEKIMGSWVGTQRTKYKNKTWIMVSDSIRREWEEALEKHPALVVKDNIEEWRNTLNQVISFLEEQGGQKEDQKPPSAKSKDNKEKIMGTWVGTQRKTYKKKTNIMGLESIRREWEKALEKHPALMGKNTNMNKSTTSQSKSKVVKNMNAINISNKESNTEDESKRLKFNKSELSVLHKKYKTMNSSNLHKHFEDNPEDWKNYHEISKQNEQSFLKEEIPRNLMIKHLEGLPDKKQKIVSDLGCGFAEINDHFEGKNRFIFHNFDHVSSSSKVVKRDIRDTGLDDCSVDIAILSLAMWGSNCKEFIREAYRILDVGGTILISEPYKRWYDEEKNEIRLIKILEEDGFKVIKCEEKKFLFIEARK
jgi:hypothetical protein